MTTTFNLQCTIDAAVETRLGEPVLVTGTLRNTGSTGLWLLPWATFLDGPIGDYARVRLDGVAIRYDGLFVRRRPPRAEDFIYLAPGQARSGTIDLGEAYAIDRTGEIEVAFALRLTVAEGGREAPPPAERRERAVVTSPPVRIRVVAGAPPSPTAGQRLRAEAPEPSPAGALPSWTPPKSPTPPQISGANQQMTEQIQQAWDRGYQASVKAWELVQALLNSSNPQNDDYDTWFGTYSVQNAQTVLNTFQQIILTMANPKQVMQIKAGSAATSCTGTLYGYSGYHAPYIALCDTLFGSTLSEWWYWTDWDDERMLTVVHEMTHLVANTVDGAYGESASAELAETDPAEAVETADNYAYFALAVEGSYQEPDNGVWVKDTTPFSASIQGRPGAAVSQAGGSLMLAWQDSNSWLWVNELNFSKGSWGSKSKLANPASPKKYRIAASGPALAAVGTTFYMLYIDGDAKSPTYNAILCLQSADYGEHWSLPAVVITAPGSTLSPSLLAGPSGQLYGLYTGAGGALYSIVGTPAADGTSVSWNQPVALNVVSTFGPALGYYEGMFYLVAVAANGTVQMRTSSDFVSWAAGPLLPLVTTSAAPALSSWSVPGENNPWLMCLYRGVEPDRHLYYAVFDGSTWGVPVREAQNQSKGGPALAAFGPTLFALHPGNHTNKLWWSHTPLTGSLAAALKRRMG